MAETLSREFQVQYAKLVLNWLKADLLRGGVRLTFDTDVAADRFVQYYRGEGDAQGSLLPDEPSLQTYYRERERRMRDGQS